MKVYMVDFLVGGTSVVLQYIVVLGTGYCDEFLDDRLEVCGKVALEGSGQRSGAMRRGGGKGSRIDAAPVNVREVDAPISPPGSHQVYLST